MTARRRPARTPEERRRRALLSATVKAALIAVIGWAPTF